ncbi:S8 family serine peptidase [Streptomyces sp.]|uniref:S8 family serine peptidase n=1 Tax=Streptomyces sp. TaxID=1931 RepID=UPI002F3F9623
MTHSSAPDRRGDEAGSPRARRRARGHTTSRRAARPVPFVVMVLLAALGAPAAHAAPNPTPSASPSQDGIRLPVMPAQLGLGFGAPRCTKGSGTAMNAVPWAQQSLGLARTRQFTRGSGVTVGVVDTGVSPKAARLSGRVSARGDAAHDCVGHGTFIAGIIAAAPTAGAGFSGVAPGARILAARGTDVTGVPDAALVAKGIRAVVDGGAKIVEVSVALQADSPALKSAVAYAARRDVLVVAAAVPDGSLLTATGDTPAAMPFWPAAAPGVLSVLDYDINGARQQTAIVPVRADLAAPGQGVTGIGPSGDGYFLGNGAAVAAAFVAGTAALVRAYHPELTAPQVAQRLLSTAYPAAVPRLDPGGAIAAVLPRTTSSAAPGPAAIHLTPPVPDDGAARRAYTLAGGCVLLTLTLWGAVALSRRGRTRREPEAVPPIVSP